MDNNINKKESNSNIIENNFHNCNYYESFNDLIMNSDYIKETLKDNNKSNKKSNNLNNKNFTEYYCYSYYSNNNKD